MFSADQDSFISSFLICMLFIYFSCLITVTRSSSNILTTHEENICFCLIPDLRGNIFILSPLYMTLALGLFVDTL